MKTWLLAAAFAAGIFGVATANAGEHFHVHHEHTYPHYHPPAQQQDQGNAARSTPRGHSPQSA